MGAPRLRLAPVVGAILFLAALYVLHLQLTELTLADVTDSLRRLPHGAVALALLLTAVNYAVLTGYDQLAFVYVGRAIPRWQITMASFVGYAIANSVGFAVLSGTAARIPLLLALGTLGLRHLPDRRLLFRHLLAGPAGARRVEPGVESAVGTGGARDSPARHPPPRDAAWRHVPGRVARLRGRDVRRARSDTHLRCRVHAAHAASGRRAVHVVDRGLGTRGRRVLGPDPGPAPAIPGNRGRLRRRAGARPHHQRAGRPRRLRDRHVPADERFAAEGLAPLRAAGLSRHLLRAALPARARRAGVRRVLPAPPRDAPMGHGGRRIHHHGRAQAHRHVRVHRRRRPALLRRDAGRNRPPRLSLAISARTGHRALALSRQPDRARPAADFRRRSRGAWTRRGL